MNPKAGDAAILLAALAQLGYALDKNLAFEPRGSSGKDSLLPQLMAELKAKQIDAVVTVGYPPAVIAKVSGIPTVVASGSGDPVATGLIESLARPGGTVTGISDVASTLSTKRLELLKEMAPHLRRVACCGTRMTSACHCATRHRRRQPKSLAWLSSRSVSASRTISTRPLRQ
jgi:putative ABC transport system substrate-binding protein